MMSAIWALYVLKIDLIDNYDPIYPDKDSKFNLQAKYRKSRGKSVYLLFCKSCSYL